MDDFQFYIFSLLFKSHEDNGRVVNERLCIMEPLEHLKGFLPPAGTEPVQLDQWPGLGCSKLTTSSVNVLLKFQTLISEIRQYFLLKKCEKL